MWGLPMDTGRHVHVLKTKNKDISAGSTEDKVKI